MRSAAAAVKAFAAAACPWHGPKLAGLLLAGLLLEGGASLALASPPQDTALPALEAAPAASAPERSVVEWIERMHGAPCSRAYAGTFVVLAATGAMASSRIWHACDGQQRMERVEALTGTPRIVFRRNDEVRTFLPQSRIVRTDRREAAGLFSRVPAVSGASISQFYASRLLGQERVAGFVADVVWLKPRDSLRFGYRLWSERETGMVVKLQTLARDGKVLEQAAFSELDLRAPVRVEELSRMMEATEGYKVVAPSITRTTAQAEGWTLRQPVAGFVPVHCHRRVVAAHDKDQGKAPDGKPQGAAQAVLQCLYSDGLATVSLFMEPYDPARHAEPSQMSGMGATQLIAQRVTPEVWLTVVGEVPLQTLKLFAGQLQRAR